jgi:quercetin dioxygenase-like cupin family protein
MEHVPSRSIDWRPAPDEWFTGEVWFGPLAPPATDEALNTLGVMFAPGARTAWHRHVEGQVLYIAHGSGIVANDAGDRVEVDAGDTVVIPAGEVHWHGASATSHMMHLSLTTGGPTEWTGRKVDDADYAG